MGLWNWITSIGRKVWSAGKAIVGGVFNVGKGIVHGIGKVSDVIDDLLQKARGIPIVGQVADLLRNNDIYQTIRHGIKIGEDVVDVAENVGSNITGKVEPVLGVTQEDLARGRGYVGSKIPSFGPGGIFHPLPEGKVAGPFQYGYTRPNQPIQPGSVEDPYRFGHVRDRERELNPRMPPPIPPIPRYGRVEMRPEVPPSLQRPQVPIPPTGGFRFRVPSIPPPLTYSR